MVSRRGKSKSRPRAKNYNCERCEIFHRTTSAIGRKHRKYKVGTTWMSR